jgi:hypothetical protein
MKQGNSIESESGGGDKRSGHCAEKRACRVIRYDNTRIRHFPAIRNPASHVISIHFRALNKSKTLAIYSLQRYRFWRGDVKKNNAFFIKNTQENAVFLLWKRYGSVVLPKFCQR